ncbi:DUF1214 domain-containing protein [Rhizobium leguminosarum bv. viciae]|uniref:DUF1254 domain-containing protein n=1 Tax=Rhizobium ruizarguesonis TaxID=2081791 RepID=UPI00143F5BC7|nr:DUF1214 domain-containing protein [Rhizobium ruizarguesonis]NKJ71356.1 DUF1214 domain-containing protein [Rhizobium leguminosarum bv. viciae]NKQ77939.1 hypothetical protein [Rhizobium ruizarguesonis]
MLTKRDLLRSAAAIAVGAAIARPSLLMAQSYPGIIEAKNIAEEGFIYGLPLVMNYAVMNEFAVDPKSSQFKAPFNKIDNLNHVATYEDTAVVTPNSDTPYSILWLDLRAEPMVISVPAPRDKEIRAKLAKIGIGPGKTFELKDLSLEHKAEMLIGMKQGDDKIDKWLASGNKPINGWNVSSLLGDEAFYNGDWLLRAGAAKAGLYGNDAAEAMYPFTRTDATGEPLDGSKHNYTLTFPAGQLPPVNSFWSVTMYDGKSQLLIKNPINRYLINSPMLPGMKKNEDGSLTLYIQKDSPGVDKEANWLPAPNDTIYLVMRLYWPKTEAPSILPAGQGTWQPPGINVAQY